MATKWRESPRSFRQTGGYKRVFRQKEDTPPPTTPPPPFGKLIQKLQKGELDQTSTQLADSARIQDVESITSYNWLDDGGRNSSILVPGKPPRWTPPISPPLLREDDGKYFRDKNAARYPKHPMEPAVLACLETDPTIATKTDIVACGSTLGNLLRFARGQDKTFRMLVEKVYNTVFLVRRENSPRELIPGVRGYGHSFPQAYTTWDADVPGSVSHQRIVGYKFAGLDLVVRFEADGYIAPKTTSNKTSTAAGTKEMSPFDLVQALENSSLTPRPPKSTSSLTIKEGTSSVDQKDIFDLKTRSIKTQLTKDHMAEELPRLWISRIPNFILAFHTRGEFKNEDIQIKDVREDVDKWEKEHASDLARFAELLHRLVDIVSRLPSGKMEISHQNIGTLDIHEQLPSAGDVLSAGVRARWEALSGSEKNGNEVYTGSSGEKAASDSRPAGDDNASDDDDEGGIEWDDKASDDFTACAEKCDYCGKCSY